MKRNATLDFLRFLGVVLTLFNHVHVVGKGLSDKIALVLQTGGWIGVDLFFVLSGYLVSGLIFREYGRYGSFEGVRFLVRRGFKIYPPYYFLLFFSFIFLRYMIHGASPSFRGLLIESAFLANYLPPNNGFLWSVSVEEHFYFALALLMILLIRRHRVNGRAFVAIYFSLLLFGLACRGYNYLHYAGYNFAVQYARSHFRFDALFFGVLLSWLHYDRPELIARSVRPEPVTIAAAWLACAFLATNFLWDRQDNPWMAVVNLAVNPVCFGYLMLLLLAVRRTAFLTAIRPLAWIGKYSYSIYLFHHLFELLAIRTVPQGGLPYYALYFSGALLGGILVGKTVEYPFLRLRDRYFPSRSGPEPQNALETPTDKPREL